eukprot:CAMPEP_0115014230 /NCGR_PEP_ID=MMETSP0216-20121206/25942_1 /TAXON_ID=223996 /ORGANISM="Protocruzia adherens, Strain Boccale" /LENGTH=483 /DNA_ID=CAMNT_0002383905 /DNA_START=89 /DNA_END=1540 /DNA_ORIENTATION=+
MDYTRAMFGENKDDDLFANYLNQADINGLAADRQAINKERLESDISMIQNSLTAYGFGHPGDLFSTSLPEVRKTVDVILALLKQRQKDLDFRSGIYERTQRVESDNKSLKLQIERLTSQRETLKNEIGSLQNLQKAQEKKTKSEISRLQHDLNDLQKSHTKLMHRDSQYQHELRKKEAAFNKLQEQLQKKIWTDKMLSNLKNSLDLQGAFHHNGPQLFNKNGFAEFGYMVSRGYEEMRNRLTSENHELRESLTVIQRELLDIMGDRRREIEGRRGSLGADEGAELIEMREDVFRMPFDVVGSDLIQVFQENMRRFKDFLKRTDGMVHADGDKDAGEDEGGDDEGVDPNDEFAKIKSVGHLRKLVKHYKTIVENQENLLHKSVISKPSAGALSELNFSDAKFNVLNDRGLEQAMKYVKEQQKVLENKERDLEVQREDLSKVTKQLDEGKMQIFQRRKELNDEKSKWQNTVDYVQSSNSQVLDRK